MKKAWILMMLLFLLPVFVYAGDDHKSRKVKHNIQTRVAKHCKDACRSYGYRDDLLLQCIDWCRQCISEVEVRSTSQNPSQ